MDLSENNKLQIIQQGRKRKRKKERKKGNLRVV